MAWFLTGLRHETIRLAKKHKRLREHELLILNNLLSQEAEDKMTEMLDAVAGTDDILAEVEDSVFLSGSPHDADATAAKSHYGNGPGGTYRVGGS